MNFPNLSLEEKAVKAKAIRSRLDAGDYAGAYYHYNPVWRGYLGHTPPMLRPGLVRHVLIGQQTGDFLHALLCNDLMETVGRADPSSMAHLHQLCMFLHNFMPSACRGSPAKVKAWQSEGGALSIFYDNADLEGA